MEMKTEKGVSTDIHFLSDGKPCMAEGFCLNMQPQWD